MIKSLLATVKALESGAPCTIIVEQMVCALERIRNAGHHYIDDEGWMTVSHPTYGLLQWKTEDKYFSFRHNGILLAEVLISNEGALLQFPMLESEEDQDDVDILETVTA